MAREFTLKHLRGNAANIPTLGDGEFGVALDDNQVFVGNTSTNVLVGRVTLDTFNNRPAAGVEGLVFYATDLKRAWVDDGTNWQELGISDASIQARGVRRSKVIDVVAQASAPPSSTSGDRYAWDGTSGPPHSSWGTPDTTGFTYPDFAIVTYDGTTWHAEDPEEGWRTYNDTDDVDIMLIDDGTPAWEEQPSAGSVIHNDLTSIQGGTTAQYYHITSDEHAAVNGAAAPSGANVFATMADLPTTLAGDVTGAFDTNTVEKIRGVDVNASVGITDKGILQYQSGTTEFTEVTEIDCGTV